jgi:hypothetical protein
MSNSNKGQFRRGEAHNAGQENGNALLTWPQVREIRRRLSRGQTAR